MPLTAAGYAGGSNLAGLAALPGVALDTTVIAQRVGDHICQSGFHVGGVDMALEVQVAAAASGVGESPLLALGRVDHLLRGGADCQRSTPTRSYAMMSGIRRSCSDEIWSLSANLRFFKRETFI